MMTVGSHMGVMIVECDTHATVSSDISTMLLWLTSLHVNCFMNMLPQTIDDPCSRPTSMELQ